MKKWDIVWLWKLRWINFGISIDTMPVIEIYLPALTVRFGRIGNESRHWYSLRRGGQCLGVQRPWNVWSAEEPRHWNICGEFSWNFQFNLGLHIDPWLGNIGIFLPFTVIYAGLLEDRYCGVWKWRLRCRVLQSAR